MKENDLIEFANKRNGNNGPKFKSYNEYIEWQTFKGCSFESLNEHWKQGQKNYILNNFDELDRNLKIADICSGDGVGLEFFKELGFTHVVGFEIADNKIEMSKKYGFTIENHDLCKDNFDSKYDDFFDILYSSHTLEHVLNPEYSIKNMLKMLKPNGLFYLVLPYPNAICADITHEHGYMVHCGSMPLGLHLYDNAETTENLLKTMNMEIVSKKFDSFREQEVWFILKKNKI